MALKKPKAPAEELEQTVQGDQPDDAKKTRAKSKAAPKKSQSGTKAKSSKKATEDIDDANEKKRYVTQSSPIDEPVISIAERRDAQTESDKAKNQLLDLMESYKAERVLTDFVQGVEKINGSFAAVLYHGDFKVIIPAMEAIIPPKDYRGKDPEVVHRYMLTKRLGTEFDYIVKGVDPETGIAVASRLDAMKARQKEYYFTRDWDGNNKIYEGILAEARIVSVIKSGIFVDLFGAECFISMKELSYQRFIDAGAYYRPGQRIIVRILKVDRSDRNNVKVAASVKRAQKNPFEKAIQKYVVGSHYIGTVTMVDPNGVFVAMEGGVDCLCDYPKRGRPPIGSQVTVKILGIDRGKQRIWGVITHTTTAI